MKLKDLADDAKINELKVVLSDLLYNASSLPTYNIKSREVYLVGKMMGDFFVKTDLNSDQIYPMFRDNIPWSELQNLNIVE